MFYLGRKIIFLLLIPNPLRAIHRKSIVKSICAKKFLNTMRLPEINGICGKSKEYYMRKSLDYYSKNCLYFATTRPKI